MYRHAILLTTSYTHSARVGIDVVCSDRTPECPLRPINEVHQRNVHNVPFSSFVRKVDGNTISKLVSEDPYFADVHFCASVDELYSLLDDDLRLDLLDVVRYILSLTDCSRQEVLGLAQTASREYREWSGRELFEKASLIPPFEGRHIRHLIIPEYDDQTSLFCENRLARAEDGYNKTSVIRSVVGRFLEQKSWIH